MSVNHRVRTGGIIGIYFILSTEIMENISMIKVVSIYSEMIFGIHLKKVKSSISFRVSLTLGSHYNRLTTPNYPKYNYVCSYGICFVKDTRTSLK